MRPIDIAREICANAVMGMPPVRQWRLRKQRTTQPDVSAQAAGINAQFDFFHSHIGSLDGKIVAEIGPGDTIGLAALFQRAGAARYVAVDRFLGDVCGTFANEVYSKLGGVDMSRVMLHRRSIEDRIPNERVDLVVSYNVIEHLRDPLLALSNMAAMLKPGGTMIHRIDYGPHGCWQHYPDPLTFLRVPNWLWAMMGSARGYPNRVRHSRISAHIQTLGLTLKEDLTMRGDFVLSAEIVCHAAL